ncbi:MAG: hypothetical protein HZA16_02395 [Nitrospirae bacterium]|nr:hypothetical protein [Nitrospirota bacterium]MBI5739546.1 hypothetical protein [Nitrospirota bacterium]
MKAGKSGLLMAGVIFLALAIFSSQAYAGVSVGIGVNIPSFRFAAPPHLVVVPGTYAYFAPETDVDIVFFNGYWYRTYEGRWFRARGYNGPWGVIAPSRVPGVLIELPRDYRHIYREHPRIAYRDFNRNWRRWERNKHWERDERWREGRGRERRDERREDGEGRGRHRGR